MSNETPPKRLPLVSVVGRPNVGKSTLFNRLARSRRAIVDSVPGITRDRLELPVEWCGRWFRMVDTGGIDFEDPETIPKQIVEQAQVAVEESDLIILLVDARHGLNPVESEIATILRRRKCPVIVAANKIDRPELMSESSEFAALGFETPFGISAEGGLGLPELLDAIVEALPELPTEIPDDDAIRVAVIGRPNVGKSSLINRLLGEDRVIVSDVPGTTRDAVDVRIKTPIGEIVLVDTAGLKKKGTDSERIDHVARVMAARAVERCHVALVLIDAEQGPTHQDAVIAGMAVEAGAGVVVVANKWDLVEDQEEAYPRLIDKVRDRMKAAPWASVVTVSVLTGERLQRLYQEVAEAHQNRSTRISTADLNDTVATAMRRHQPPQGAKGKEFKVKYLTQVSIGPPTFVAFTTGGKPHFSWQRFLENRLREAFNFDGTPIVVRYRGGRKGV